MPQTVIFASMLGSGYSGQVQVDMAERSADPIFQDGHLISGSLEALIERLVPTVEYYPDRTFIFTLLLSSRAFIPPAELLARVGRLCLKRKQLLETGAEADKINRNTAAMQESNKKWRQELGLPDPEPTELDLLLQKWEQARVAPQSPKPEGEEPPLPEPRGEEPPLPEPRGEEPPLPEPRGEEPPLLEPRREEPPLPEPRGEEGKSIPPPQPRSPPLQSSLALLRPVPQPLLLDTLPVFLDLPVLDLEPRSLQHWPQLCPWLPAPLSPSTQTSLGCCQTSRLLPLFAASLTLGDRTSLRRFPGEDLCPLQHPPVPRPTLRSALSARWGPVSPVRGPFLAVPEGLIHRQARPWKRAAMDIAGLEAGWSFKGGGRWPSSGLCLEKTWGGGGRQQVV
ncbi:UNVERIFIED_CONTAM: hypothetical protein FKN15_054637 [Acipenser sinensis]